jgi:hypothetical protein
MAMPVTWCAAKNSRDAQRRIQRFGLHDRLVDPLLGWRLLSTSEGSGFSDGADRLRRFAMPASPGRGASPLHARAEPFKTRVDTEAAAPWTCNEAEAKRCQHGVGFQGNGRTGQARSNRTREDTP